MAISKLYSNDHMHPDNESWHKYLIRECELLNRNDQWLHFADSNCHYFVHKPTELVISGIYGYHGYNFMRDLDTDPVKAVYSLAMAICNIKMVLETLQFIAPTIPSDSEIAEVLLYGDILEYYTKIDVHTIGEA